ncbi:MAG: DUF975 family protein [Bacilli bacterium]
MTRHEAKTQALDALKGNWGYAILISLLYAILVAVLGALWGIGTLLLGSALLVGLNFAYINGSVTHQYKVEDLFAGFKDGLSNRILLSVMKNIFVALWSILFVIPGLVKTYSYSLAEYISLQNKDLTWKECIDESRRLMDGHKMEMFLLDLSFLGWMILCAFTFGIGMLFLNPYIQATKVEYIDANIMPIKSINVQQ